MERDGDETRTRCVDPLVERTRRYDRRRKREAARLETRIEESKTKEREKETGNAENERERERERDATNDLVEEGWSRVAERNVWERRRGLKEDGGIMVEEGQKVSRSAEEASSRSWSYL